MIGRELRCGTRDLADDYYPETMRRQRAKDAWSSWAGRLHLPAIEADAARRSALTLKGLCYHPTGAFLAAATTSLPAQLGGVRNWDYRYAWLRDGAFCAYALDVVGEHDAAAAFHRWAASTIEAHRRLVGRAVEKCMHGEPVAPAGSPMDRFYAAHDALIETLEAGGPSTDGGRRALRLAIADDLRLADRLRGEEG